MSNYNVKGPRHNIGTVINYKLHHSLPIRKKHYKINKNVNVWRTPEIWYLHPNWKLGCTHNLFSLLETSTSAKQIYLVGSMCHQFVLGVLKHAMYSVKYPTFAVIWCQSAAYPSKACETLLWRALKGLLLKASVEPSRRTSVSLGRRYSLFSIPLSILPIKFARAQRADLVHIYWNIKF